MTLVTAIVAAYNEERHVARCLESLTAQTYRPLEILLADDGSTDGTVRVARRLPAAQVLSLPHRGKARTLNAAAAQARGEILVFVDADLTLATDYVAKLVAPILAGEALGTSHCDEFVANPTNRWARCLQLQHGLPPDRRLNLGEAAIAEGTVVYRAVGRDRFLAAGGFDDTGYLDDQSLYPKLGRRARFVPGAVCYHHNPDRLREVFRQGVWAGKSIHHLHGGRSALRYLPPVALARGLAAAARTRLAAMAVYQLVHDSGVCWGVAKRALGMDRTMGA
jgi:glycosyltransferase involved in cell wall biosynthesis